MKTLLAFILHTSALILLSACASPQITEVGSAVGGAYTNPRTGEAYQGSASSYVKFNGASGGKEILPPKLQK